MPIEAELARQRMSKGGQGKVNLPYLEKGQTRDKVAASVGVSVGKVRQAQAVAKAAPELMEKVKAGTMLLKEAELARKRKSEGGKNGASATNRGVVNLPHPVEGTGETREVRQLKGVVNLPHPVDALRTRARGETASRFGNVDKQKSLSTMTGFLIRWGSGGLTFSLLSAVGCDSILREA